MSLCYFFYARLLFLKISVEVNYQVCTTHSEVIDSLKYSEPDCIICNVTANGCDSRKLCNNNEINVPFIFISDLYKNEERRRCYIDSGYPYISGPILSETIEKYL